MINKLRAACDKSKETSLKLFAYEFTSFPEFLVNKEGKPYHGTKSDILKKIAPRAKQDTLHCHTAFNGLDIDLSVVIRGQAAIVNLSELKYAIP